LSPFSDFQNIPQAFFKALMWETADFHELLALALEVGA
jgi:hypothetical protein